MRLNDLQGKGHVDALICERCFRKGRMSYAKFEWQRSDDATEEYCVFVPGGLRAVVYCKSCSCRTLSVSNTHARDSVAVQREAKRIWNAEQHLIRASDYLARYLK